ncbi:hypothetical protein KIPB_002616, partial [Kipferlia bialata]|eukprot:g1555.t1
MIDLTQALATSVPFGESTYYSAYSGAGTGYAASIATTSNGFDVLAVGGPSDDTNDEDAGAVYYYLKDAQGAWYDEPSAMSACPRYADGQRFFGVSVAADGEWIAVGSQGTSVANRYGAVDIYYHEANSGSDFYIWKQTLTAENDVTDATESNFGVHVEMDSGRIAVSSYLETTDGTVQFGSVYVYSYSGDPTQVGGWDLEDTLWDDVTLFNRAAFFDKFHFGYSICLSADTLYVTTGYTGGWADNLTVYDRESNGTWTRYAGYQIVAKTVATSSFSRFNLVVRGSGDTVSLYSEDDTDNVYTLDISSTSDLDHLDTLSLADTTEGGIASLAYSSDTIVIGTANNYAMIYSVSTAGELSPTSTISGGNGFGGCVATIDGDRAVVGGAPVTGASGVYMLNAGESDSSLSAVPAGVLTSAGESSPTPVTVGVVDVGDSPVAGALVDISFDGALYTFSESGGSYANTVPLSARGGDSLDLVLYLCPEAVTGSYPITHTLCPVLETQTVFVTYTATSAVTVPAMVSDTVVDVTVYDQNGIKITDPAATVTLTPSGGSAAACTLDTYYGTYGCRTGSNTEGYITASLSVTPASAGTVTVPTSLSVYSEGTPFSRAVDLDVGGTMPYFNTAVGATGEGDGYYEFVSIDGDWMVVGQPDENIGGVEKAGRVLVYRRDGYTWAYHQTLTIPTAVVAESQVFGQSVSVSGDWIAVAAPGASITDPDDSVDYKGWIYLYKLDESSDTWVLTDTVHSYATYASAWFGDKNMVLVGDTLVCGASSYLKVGGKVRGAVVTYTMSGDVWTLSQTLTTEIDIDTWYSDGLGGFIGFDGTTIVSLTACGFFSCPYYNDATKPYIQIWERNESGTFVLQDPIVSSGYVESRTPRVSGDWMAVGQFKAEGYVGVVKMWHKEGGEWVAQPDVTGVDTKYFGKALEIDGDYMVVGAPNHGGDDLYGRVSVYHLFRGASEWVETQAVVGTQYQQQIGYSVALDASTGMLVSGNQNEYQADYVGGFPSGASPHVLTMSTGPVADITPVPVVELDTTEVLVKFEGIDGTLFDDSSSVSFFYSDDETETPTAMAYSAGDEGFTLTAIPADTFSLGDSLMIQAYVPTPLPADTEHFTFDTSTGEATVETEPVPCGVSAAPLYKDAMDLCLSLLDEEDVAQSGLLLETSVKWKLKGADDSTYHIATWSAAEGAYTAESPVTD